MSDDIAMSDDMTRPLDSARWPCRRRPVNLVGHVGSHFDDQIGRIR